MSEPILLHGELTRSIIGAFYETFDHLGPFYPEHVYSKALELELVARGHRVDREVSSVVMYKGQPLCRLRLDMVVDDLVVVEIKATTELHPSALPQLFAYLKATTLEVGLLFHYGPVPKFHRLIHTNDRPGSPNVR